MFGFNFCSQNRCCGDDKEFCEGGFGDSDFVALPVFDESNFILEASDKLGGFCTTCDETTLLNKAEKNRRHEGWRESESPYCEEQIPVFPGRRHRQAAEAPRAASMVESAEKGGQVFGSPACLYHAHPGDPLDEGLVHSLKFLDEYSKATLILRRLQQGRYEIDGRLCTLRFDEYDVKEILVWEDGSDEELLLPAYLNQAANVAVSLSKPLSAKARQPSFSAYDAAGSRLNEDIDDYSRTHSMEVACMQAKLRQTQLTNPPHSHGSGSTHGRFAQWPLR